MIVKYAAKIAYEFRCGYCKAVAVKEYVVHAGGEVPYGVLPSNWTAIDLGDGYQIVVCPDHSILVDQKVAK